MKISSPFLAVLALVFLFLIPAAHATSDSWNVDVSGNYTDAANWLGGNVPGTANGTISTDTASFSKTLSVNRTVTLTSIYAINAIAFGNTSTFGYTLSGSTFRINTGGVIQTLTGTGAHNDVIASAIQLRGLGNSTFTFRNDSTNGGLIISGDINSTTAAGKTYTIFLDGTSTVASTVGQNTSISGNINNGSNGTVAIVKNGTGLWTLQGNNTFAGGLTVNAGTIRYFGVGYTPFGTGTVTINDGVVFQKANSSAVLVNNTMTVNGNFRFSGTSVGNDWSGAMNLAGGTRVITADADLTISGVVSNGGITKNGTNTLTLSGNNTFAGGMTINAGTMLVNGDSSAATGAVNVASGATLGGSGKIGGAVTVQSGGVLSPGNSPSVLTVASLSLNSGSTTNFEINGTGRGTAYDGLDIIGGGAIQFGGTFAISFGSSLANNTVLDLFNFTTTSTGDFSSMISTGTYAGTWSKTGEIWSLASGGQTFNFSEITGDLSVVPEPATCLLLAAGLTVTLVLRRRRVS